MPHSGTNEDGYDGEHAELVFELFGDSPVVRREAAKALYEHAGVDARFMLYKDVGHQVTPQMRNDVLQFFRDQVVHLEQKAEGFGEGNQIKIRPLRLQEFDSISGIITRVAPRRTPPRERSRLRWGAALRTVKTRERSQQQFIPGF